MKPYIEALRKAQKAGEVMDALFMATTAEEVAEFMAEYRTIAPTADDNIKCMLGYESAETERKYRALLDGRDPSRFDGMAREALIARIVELEGAS